MNEGGGSRAQRTTWIESRGRIRERLEVLERSATELLTGTLEASRCSEAERNAGDLTAILPSFGMAEATEVARRLEARFATGPPFATPEIAAVSDQTVALVRLVEEQDRLLTERPPGAGTGAGPETASQTPRAVWLVGHDPDTVDRLEERIRARGWTAHRFDAVGAAIASMDRALDHLVVTWEEEAASLLRAARRAHPDATLLVLGEESDLDARVTAAQAGADRYLPHDIPLDRVLVLAEGSPEGGPRSERILAVTADPDLQTRIQRLLRIQGYSVRSESGADTFWKALEEQDPELVLLDLDLPSSALDICRVLRSDPSWAPIPVQLLTSETDPALQGQAWEAGPDDVSMKPLRERDFLARVRNRLHRTRTVRESAGQDLETGTPDAANGWLMMHRLVAVAVRDRMPAAIALVGRKRPHGDLFSHEMRAGIVRGLQRSLRPDDLIYRDEGRVYIGSFGEDRSALAERIRHALEQDTESDALRAAVAGLGTDGDSLDALCEAAETALAGSWSRDLLVHFAGSEPEGLERPDIVLIEEEEVAARLLRHAFEGDGLQVRWIRDGQEALHLLTGPTRSMRPRVILLDFNLPGVDGLSLLRRFRKDPGLERTRIVVLSARSLESEIIKSLQLGADDYVTKPFSVPVLRTRVRRYMGE